MVVKFPFTHSFLDYPSSYDSCLSLYMTGCEHKCKECSNPEFQDHEYVSGTMFNYLPESLDSLIGLIETYCFKYKTKNICLLGGDPLFQPFNMNDTKYILENMIGYNFCIYTGYDVDYCIQNEIKGFTFLKTGKYISNLSVESEKTDDYVQFASTNQNLYDSNFNLLSKDGRYYFN